MDGNNNVFVHGKVCGVAYTCTCTSPRFLSNTLISTFVCFLNDPNFAHISFPTILVQTRNLPY